MHLGGAGDLGLPNLESGEYHLTDKQDKNADL